MRVRRSQRRAGNEAGFTLIEIVIALAILGAGMFVLLESHFASTNLFASAQESAALSALIERAAGQAEAAVLAGESAGQGEFGARFPDYTYEFEAAAVSAEDFPGLLEVTLTVFDPEESTEITFYTYDGVQVEN